MTSIRPFTIAIDDATIADLHGRLGRTRWPDAETVDDWSQGIPLAYVKELAGYWLDGYDWRERESRLNRFEHFVTDIDGHDVHFIHARSAHEEATPLVLTHGWPGSIVEFDKVIAPLVDPTSHGGESTDAFHVVAPSLPGFGFSAKPSAPGTGVEQIAAMWDSLMERLGYDRYVAQGGDWGSAVTTMIGQNHDDHCFAIHTNMPLGAPGPDDATDAVPDDEMMKAIEARKFYQDWDSGYSKQQSTRPQTLGYGLVDSPVGQMAWIIEKFHRWMDCDNHPENVLSKDELLDNVMMYWLNATGASSGRIYWESFGRFGAGKVNIPTGIASYPGEIIRTPRRWAENMYNITHWATMPKGGHFAAFEQPELFVDDLRTFFATVR